MKDNARATLVGTKTYGKGIMQQLSAQGSKDEYMFTIAYYIPPSGENIHEVGVEPDVEVSYPEITEEEMDAYIDLVYSDRLENWVDSHPDFTKENIMAFALENPDIGVSADALNIVVRNQYIARMPYSQTPKADPWFDPQLRAAIQVLLEKLNSK